MIVSYKAVYFRVIYRYNMISCLRIGDSFSRSRFYIDFKTDFLKEINSHVSTNFKILEEYMTNNSYLDWIKPEGGCISFPWIKNDVDLSIRKFNKVLKETYKTFIAPGHWFEVDERFFRIGYGYPSETELEGGLQCITAAIEDCIQ